MAVEVVMPRLSDTMEEGKVLKWLKKEGEPVKRGEAIAEIETDKAAMELESFDTGTLSKIIVPEGQTVPVGQPIAVVDTAPAAAGAAPPAPKKETAAAAAGPQPPTPTQPPAKAAAPTPLPEEERVKASPLAKRIAEERGIDLDQVKGTGPDGRITKEDVLAYIKQMEEAEEARRKPAAPPAPVAPTRPAVPPTAPPLQPTEARTVDLTKMQATIAERMTKAKQTVPHFYVTTDIEMSEASRMIEALKSAGEEGTTIGYNDLLIKAAALALQKFPIVNASFHDGKLQYNERINIGIAVALPQGLMVPVVHDCDKKTLRQIAEEAREVINRVREGRLHAEDFEGGTFTISNLGMFEVDHFAAIIDPPESAILAIGSVRVTPVVRNGQIVVGQMMKATISADHRVYYGATAAQFVQEFKRLLENPITLVL